MKLSIFRNRRIIAINAIVFSILMVFDMAFATVSLALTGGPSQPEVSSFTPVSTSDLVNLSSGDFTYNIPLLDVGGYPLNISYNSGISMDEEASWVGLGWNLNPGVVNRNMRALPDDFNGLGVTKEFYMKEDRTYGISAGANTEVFGQNINLGLSLGVKWNNYNGVGVNTSIDLGVDVALPHAEKNNGAVMDLGVSLGGGNDGYTISPSVGLASAKDEKANTSNDPSLNLGLGFNSRAGFKGMTLSGSIGNSGAKIVNINGYESSAKRRLSAGSSAGTSISFLPNTYAPKVQNSRHNFAVTFNYKAGIDIFGTDPSGHIEGFYSRSKIKETTRVVDSYGYLYAENGSSKTDQHDFNRENDMAYAKDDNRLPLTNQTYDIFSAAGQGLSGMFRPYRNDVGAVYDPLTKSSGQDGSVGFEAGTPAPTLKTGGDLTVNVSNSHSGVWDEQNSALPSLKFENRFDETENYEPSYFREVGELAVDDEMSIDATDGVVSFLEKIGGNRPVRVDLKERSGEALSQFENNVGETISFPDMTDRFKQKDRKKRNQLFSHLSVGQAAKYAVRTRNITKKAENNSGVISTVPGRAINLSTGEVKTDYQDQMGEITILQEDGSRYVYGKPLYNTKQKEVTFNASTDHNQINQLKGTVSYLSTDAQIENGNGIDHYYSSTTLPPFAHSFMITEILSVDYSDSDNIPGPSAGDYGSYTVFDYEEVSDYKWRTPYEDANHNTGFNSIDTDDKGSYIYGEKDLAYLAKVETKTHVAIFKMSDREDALGAQGEHPGESGETPKRMRKLDAIELYSLPEYKGNPSTAVPIKTAHFTYDYLLGSGNTVSETLSSSPIPNNSEVSGSHIINQGGKLTLQSVYFTYRTSNKAKFSKYEFDYTNPNYSYDIKAYDIWGNYKPSNLEAFSDETSLSPTTVEFPYVNQDETVAHDYASAWHISEIKLPSGGSIKVEFESDDYLHVQDKRAMQMFRVMGTLPEGGSAVTGVVFGIDQTQTPQEQDITVAGALSDKLYTDIGGYLWTCVANEEPLTRAEWNSALYGLIDAQAEVQFRYLVNIFKDGHKDFEYVSGYAKLTNQTDLCPEGESSRYAWVKFKGVNKENKKNEDAGTEHPVSKAGWNFTRQYLPKKAYNQTDFESASTNTTEDGLTDFFIQIAQANIVGPLKEALKGPNGYLRSENKSRNFKQGRSWIRLNCPKAYKYGGGSRVKTIVSNDNWSVMSEDVTAKDSQFGQTYSYKTKEGRSSGVAAFEPLISKENPWVVPVKHTQKNRYILPKFMEEPLGASFFPSPRVTYSRVKVEDIVYENNVETSSVASGTGYAVNEFYTTKDFPTKVSLTKVEAISQKNSPIGGLTQINIRNLMAVSQGYQVEINDMDGKPKSTRIYGQGQTTAISGVDYAYEELEEINTTDGAIEPSSLAEISNYTLNNDVVTINEFGEVNKSTVGVEVDVVSDFREDFNKTRSFKTRGNMSLIYALAATVPVPTVFPNTNKTRTRFRSAVVTKVINRRGILRETVAFDNGASVSTKNLAYDANTGQVLLTSTRNEFSDEIFNLNLPAYWAYKEMGQASENIGYSRKLKTDENGQIISEANESNDDYRYLVYGDELAIEIDDCAQRKGWLWHTKNGTTNDDNKYVIDASGNPIHLSNKTRVTVIKSGYRNTHGASMTSMTLMTNPLPRTAGGEIDNGQKLSVVTDQPTADHQIIDVSSIEYSDRWKTFESEKIVEQIDCYGCFGCDDCADCPECPDCGTCGCPDCSDCDIDESCWTKSITDANFTFDDIHGVLVSAANYINGHKGYDFIGTSNSNLFGWKPGEPIKTFLVTEPIPSYPNAVKFKITDKTGVPDDVDLYPNNSFTNNVNDLNPDNPNHFEEFRAAFDVYLYNSNDERIGQLKNVLLLSEISESYTLPVISNIYHGVDIGSYNYLISWFYTSDFNSANGSFNSNGIFTDALFGGTHFEGPALSQIFWGGNYCGAAAIDILNLNSQNEPDLIDVEGAVNPFVENARGQFKPISSYAYLGERNYQYDPEVNSNQTNIRTDGVYSSYSPFWQSNAQAWSKNEANWTWTSSITEFNPYGPEVENINALNQLSSAQFGYNSTIPVAVAANASYHQMGYDGFEDYIYDDSTPLSKRHFACDDFSYWKMETAEVHSGRYSRRISVSEELKYTRALDTDPSDNYCNADPLPQNGAPYYLRSCDELGVFGPETYDAGMAHKTFLDGGDLSTVQFRSQKYVLSYWIHEKFKKYDMDDSEAKVMINGSHIVFDESKESEIIEGWKKYDHVFTIPANASGSIELIIKNNRTSGNIYVDDLRIHPVNASMKSYAYDPVTLRLLAELDDNNFATFYEYDEEGRLLRIKKETERGIKTIQESRTHTQFGN